MGLVVAGYPAPVRCLYQLQQSVVGLDEHRARRDHEFGEPAVRFVALAVAAVVALVAVVQEEDKEVVEMVVPWVVAAQGSAEEAKVRCTRVPSACRIE